MAELDLLQRVFETRMSLRGEQSDDRVAVTEGAVPAGWEAAPLHYHDWDEAFM